MADNLRIHNQHSERQPDGYPMLSMAGLQCAPSQGLFITAPLSLTCLHALIACLFASTGCCLQGIGFLSDPGRLNAALQILLSAPAGVHAVVAWPSCQPLLVSAECWFPE